MNKIMDLQEKWDVSQVPINLQDYMLYQLFGSLQEEPNVLRMGDLTMVPCQLVDY
jgi:hypothetical protein